MKISELLVLLMLYGVSWGACPDGRKKETVFLVLQINGNSKKYFGVVQEIPGRSPDFISWVFQVYYVQHRGLQKIWWFSHTCSIWSTETTLICSRLQWAPCRDSDMALESTLSEIFEVSSKFLLYLGLGFESSIHKTECLTRIFTVWHVGGTFLQ